MTFEQTVLHCAAPALCGIKSACLFSFPAERAKDEIKKIKAWNSQLCSCGKEIRVLCPSSQLRLFFIYDKVLLTSLLSNPGERAYLLKKGFPLESGFDAVLAELFHRLAKSRSDSFPHEVGLFLGYPLEDVIAFEEGKKSKYTGCWQVYGDVSAAVKRMESYRECSRCCCELLNRGLNVPYISQNYFRLKKIYLKEAC